jgi:hypothetical protein
VFWPRATRRERSRLTSVRIPDDPTGGPRKHYAVRKDQSRDDHVSASGVSRQPDLYPPEDPSIGTSLRPQRSSAPIASNEYDQCARARNTYARAAEGILEQVQKVTEANCCNGLFEPDSAGAVVLGHVGQNDMIAGL